MIASIPTPKKQELAPEPNSARRDRWQLTPESFQALLKALEPAAHKPAASDQASSGSASSQPASPDAVLLESDQSRPAAVERYRRLHQRLVFFFMRHRAIHPEDLADICLNRLARKVADNESIDNIEAFTLGIARMVQREDQAGALRNQLAFSEWMRNESLTASTSSEDKEENQLDIMQEHFAALPPSSRQMLASYHLGRGTARIERRQQLAHQLGISIGTLRKRVFDLQAQLRLRLQKGKDHSLQHMPSREEPEHS